MVVGSVMAICIMLPSLGVSRYGRRLRSLALTEFDQLFDELRHNDCAPLDDASQPSRQRQRTGATRYVGSISRQIPERSYVSAVSKAELTLFNLKRD